MLVLSSFLMWQLNPYYKHLRINVQDRLKNITLQVKASSRKAIIVSKIESFQRGLNNFQDKMFRKFILLMTSLVIIFVKHFPSPSFLVLVSQSNPVAVVQLSWQSVLLKVQRVRCNSIDVGSIPERDHLLSGIINWPQHRSQEQLQMKEKNMY